MSKNALRPLPPKDQSALNTAIRFHQSGSIDKAKDIYQGLLKKNPENVNLNYLLGAVAVQQKEWLKAVGLIDKAIKVNPDNPTFYYNRALANYGMQNLEEAILDYGLAISKKPDYIEAYLNLGVAEQDMLQHEAAIKSYDKAIALNPRNVSAYVRTMLGRASRLHKKLDELVAQQQYLDVLFKRHQRMADIIHARVTRFALAEAAVVVATAVLQALVIRQFDIKPASFHTWV